MPPSALDTLIDQLGGAKAVAEMTGRRARMVRAHETELAARQRELASLEQRLGEAVGEKDRLVEERQLFTRALYSKFVRDSVGDDRGRGRTGKARSAVS